MQSHHHHTHAARYGSTSHIVYHEHSEPGRAETLRELIRPWTIRQWIAGGRMHRELSPREVPRFELFFDLLYVAVIHQLAEAAIEEPGLPAVVRFLLTFWPSWSIWDEARKYANVSGTDDLLHRTWILIGMITILGYSASVSAITLHPSPTSAGDHVAVRAAVAFWLIIKLTRVLMLFLYAYRLPLFRTSQILGGIAVLIPMLVYTPLLWVTHRPTQIVLASTAFVVDLARVDLMAYNVMGRMRRWRRQSADGVVGDGERAGLLAMPKLDEGVRIPALNIEHGIERSSAFVVIVLGELVMNLLYKASYADLGLSSKFGKACLGMMIAWALNYLYLLPSEPNAEYEHALRRSWLTGSVFTFLHWPLVACLILASAACGELMLEPHVERGVAWYWSAGLAGAILCIALIDMMHADLSGRQRVPRTMRFALSILVAAGLAAAPALSGTYPSARLLGVGAGATWLLLVVHVVGMLPRSGAGAGTREGASRVDETGEGRPDGRQEQDGVAAL